MSRLRAAASLLPAPLHLPPPASAPPAALQTHPGEALQALPADPRRLQGLQRYTPALCAFIFTRNLSFYNLFFSNPSSAALADISEMVLQLQGTMMKMENFQKLLELKKDLTGIDNLAIPGRVRLFTFFGCYLWTFKELVSMFGV